MGVLAQNYNGRMISDNNLIVTTALPAAGAATTGNAIDTGDNTDGIFPEGIVLNLSQPSAANQVSASVITYTILADTANPPTTALSPSLTYTSTGTAGNGAAFSVTWKLPPNTGRYLAVKASCDANTGNNIAVSYTMKLLGAGTDSN